MVRTRTDGGLCTYEAWACTPSTTTFIWAGDQLLWELKSASGTYAAAAGGNVSYFHAGGIDRPLVITKNSESIVPHVNFVGDEQAGIHAWNSLVGSSDRRNSRSRKTAAGNDDSHATRQRDNLCRERPPVQWR
jgi:hypothetical protein